MEPGRNGFVAAIKAWPGFRVFAYPDFRLIWIGAFLSFTGSQVQMVAQGAYVYDITGSKSALAFVTFCSMIPVTVFGPILGAMVDIWDRRKIMIGTSILLSAVTGANAIAASFGVLTYAQILAVALIGGFVQTVEPPSRQTIVREVVGDKELASAIPLQAMTFNLARVIGPAIGGVLAAALGYAVCFWVNTFSFLAVGISASRIKTKLAPGQKRVQPIRDLIAEGIRYTFRNPNLRLLFFMEAAISTFGTSYLFQMPAITKDLFGLGKAGLGMFHSAVGVGAFLGLITITSLSVRPIKTKIVRFAMGTFVVAMVLLSIAPSPILALPCVALLGACTIMQFNTTNTLFQMLSPEALRGRVISMHMWAIAGLAPVGTLAMGWVADVFGLRTMLLCGAAGVGACFLFALSRRQDLAEPPVA